MDSFVYSEWLSDALHTSGNFRMGTWELILVNSQFQSQPETRITPQNIPPASIVARVEVPVSLDRANVRVQAAVEEVVIPNVGNMAPTIVGVIIMPPTLVAAAYIGPALVGKGFRPQDRQGDLVIKFNETCPALLEL